MLILQGVGYAHPNRDILFTDINLTVNKHDKIALVGNNGTGKSTLLQVMAGTLHPFTGQVKANVKPYYVPQLFGQYNDYTIAQALQINVKIQALKAILNGDASEYNFTLLNDDWNIEERCALAFARWGLNDVNTDRKMATLSGGQKTKVFLAGIHIHNPQLVLLDEPSNHLDASGRQLLYEYIQGTTDTIVVVSHDRTLLNMLPAVYELDKRGVTVYGGNYEFYAEQKAIENNAIAQDVRNKEKALRKAKETEREAIERKQKMDARGKSKQEKAGLPTISMNTLRNNAEKSTARIKGVHTEKIDDIWHELDEKRKELPGIDTMKMGFENSAFHKGKILVTATGINYKYHRGLLWKDDLDFQITAGERLAIKGANGSGKSTLARLITAQLQPPKGAIAHAGFYAIYVDQDYSLVANNLTIYEQVQQYNDSGLQDHEIKIRLTHFLFTKEYWDKPCSVLSGGEKMRLLLCSLTIQKQAPDMIVLDEPTNNLDIRNTEILTAAIKEYKGTCIVISHDEYFLEHVNIERIIQL